jgi:hypothetical protein
MKIHKLTIALILVFLCFFSYPGQAQQFDNYLVKTLDMLATRALAAYNAGDYTAFSQYFAKKTEDFNQPRHFDAEFISMHKKNLGMALRKKIILAESSLDHHFPELIYEAEFKNYEKVIVTINFINQNDNYRITRIRFDRVYDGNKHL